MSQSSPDPTPTPPTAEGEAEVAPWVLVVRENETLVLTGENATMRGPGILDVRGRLVLEGDATSKGYLRDVRIQLTGAGPHHIANVVFATNGTVLRHEQGLLALEHARFDGGAIAIHALAAADVRATDVVFAEQRDAAIVLDDAARLTLTAGSFSGGAPSIRAATSGALDVRDSTFRGRAAHLVAQAPDGWRGSLTNDSFGPAPTGVLVTASGPATLTLERNRFRGMDVALEVAGAGLRVKGANDTLVDNGVGIRVEGASVEMQGTVFGNNTVPFEGAVTLQEPTFLTQVAQPPGVPAATSDEFPAPASTTATWVLVGLLGVLLAGSGGAWLARDPLRRRVALLRARLLPKPLRDEARERIHESLERGEPASVEDVARRAGIGTELARAFLDQMADEGALETTNDGSGKYRLAAPAPPPDAPPPDLGAPLTTQEARVLRDMLDHPGTPQSAVAQRLGLSRQALHYHVKKLETRGLVTKITKGRETHCYVRAEARALLPPNAAPPVAPPSDPTTVSRE